MRPENLNINKLAKRLKEKFPEILFAFLFGSSKDGKIRKGSDIDLAIYIQECKDTFTLISRILKIVESEISTDNFDLVILNDTDPVLAMEALQGKILFIRKEAMDTYTDFYSLTCRVYEDHIFWTKKQLEYRGYEVQWDY